MRILHTSIPVRYTGRAAPALVEQGKGAAFDSLHSGCCFARFGEPVSLLELDRQETELYPGERGKPCEPPDGGSSARVTGSCTAIRVSGGADRVAEMARSRGWCAEVHRRRVFRVIELWIENEYPLDVFPPEFASECLPACELVCSAAPQRGIA